ncbi:uncharacterized protein LOC134845247 [Symsagittifera roscoffensis]|uniref:uncharacterized protein LOC134845247 n=1 Tax=Symsagittifera roscoffensis TaxID=84072 RepID=UPI00307B3072
MYQFLLSQVTVAIVLLLCASSQTFGQLQDTRVCSNNLECQSFADDNNNDKRFCCDTTCSSESCIGASVNVALVVLISLGVTLLAVLVLVSLIWCKCKKPDSKIGTTEDELRPPSYGNQNGRVPAYVTRQNTVVQTRAPPSRPGFSAHPAPPPSYNEALQHNRIA